MNSLTVVICAYTEARWTTLKCAIDMASKQVRFDDELIVVVDHNESLLARCRDAMDNCTIIRNRHSRGLSGARNTAIEQARGSIIVFLDDDAIPLDGWLNALRTPYADERVFGVGGYAAPRWSREVPSWFPDEFLWVVGCSYRGLPAATEPVRNLIGVNMSFRKVAFDKLGGFVETMGRVNDRPLGCEETEFSIRLTREYPDAVLLYNPSARVEHHVAGQRGSVRYFARRCWAEGLSKAEVSRRVGPSDALSTERHYVTRVLPSGIWYGFRDGTRGDLRGIARAAAIVLGLAVTGAGYCAGSLRWPARGRREAIGMADGPHARDQRSVPRLLRHPAARPADVTGPADHEPEVPSPPRRLRVLEVSARFLPDMGGVETHVYEVTRRLAGGPDLDLTVLTTDRSATLPAREEIDGFAVLRCRSYPRHRDYYFAPQLPALISNGNYDLIHCQGIHTAVPVLAMLAARRAGIPYVVTLHTGGHSSGLRHRLRNLQWRILGPLLRGATTVVAVSRFEQQLFEKACGIDPSRFRIIRNGGELPPAGGPVARIPGRIVSSGRLERYKGHHRVIQALPIVQRSIPQATLHILGSGPYEGKLRKLVAALGLEKSVTIECIAPGDRAKMAASLGAAAALAALSEYEAHPVAVTEALTLGLPVVGLKSTGIGDLVDEGLVTGVAKDASPAAVALALVTALKEPPADRPAALAGWDSAAADLARIYQAAARTSHKLAPTYGP